MMSAHAAHAEVEDSWFVAFGPNDVRTLSLEQLDDAYRLDVINDETLVCSTTMNNWVPLGVVVGSDAPAPVVPQVAQASSISSGDQLFGRAAYVPPAYSPASYPPAAYSAVAPTSLMPTSMAPAVYDVGPAIQYQYPTGRSRWVGPLMFLTLCAVAFGAFRLGAASQMAGAIGMKPQFAALTQRVLGAPGIETLEGVQVFIDRISKEYRLDEIQVMGDRLAGVSAVLAPSKPSEPAVVPAVPVAAPAAVAAAPSEPAASAIDINSLPRAETEAAAAPAPAVLSNTHASRATTPVAPEEPKVTPGVLDTNAMRAALERSKKKSKKKDRFSKAAAFDPMNSTVE